MNVLYKTNRALSNVGLFITIAVLMWLIFRWIDPKLSEYIYSDKLFNCLRCSIDYTLGRLPFSIGLLVFALILARCWSYRWATRSGKIILLLKCLSIIVILFYTMWGYNYKRVPLLEKLDMEAPHVDSLSLIGLFNTQISKLSKLKLELRSDYQFEAVQENVRSELKDVLIEHGYKVRCKPVLRRLPKGILLRFSTAGMYNPFLGEGYIDRGLHEIQKPFVIGHELSHAFGITDEGEANFWGYLSCKNSEDPDIRYSGELGFFRYVLSDLYRYSPKKYQEMVKAIPSGILDDLRSIDKNNDLYPDILPAIRDAIYGTYLKSQGVAKGLRSYNDVVTYYLAWSDKKKE